MVEQDEIILNGESYYIHPTHKLYAGNKNGYIINITKIIPMRGNISNSGYFQINVRKDGKQKGCQSHRFIWECFNGLIDNGLVIDHINDIKTDNRICNLQILTVSQNNRKSFKNRDYSFAAKNHTNIRCVKAINIESGDEKYFKSLYAAKQNLSINAGQIKMICEGKNHVKTGISKKDGKRYRFEYIAKEDIPSDEINPNNKMEKQ